jgi:hypothetical protein
MAAAAESKFQRQVLHWTEPPRKRELSCGAARATSTASLGAGPYSGRRKHPKGARGFE